MSMFLKSFGFLQTFHQLVSNFVALNAHHAFFGAAIAEEIDAAIPNNFLVDYGEFLMNIGPEIR